MGPFLRSFVFRRRRSHLLAPFSVELDSSSPTTMEETSGFSSSDELVTVSESPSFPPSLARPPRDGPGTAEKSRRSCASLVSTVPAAWRLGPTMFSCIRDLSRPRAGGEDPAGASTPVGFLVVVVVVAAAAADGIFSFIFRDDACSFSLPKAGGPRAPSASSFAGLVVVGNTSSGVTLLRRPTHTNKPRCFFWGGPLSSSARARLFSNDAASFRLGHPFLRSERARAVACCARQ